VPVLTQVACTTVHRVRGLATDLACWVCSRADTLERDDSDRNEFEPRELLRLITYDTTTTTTTKVGPTDYSDASLKLQGHFTNRMITRTTINETELLQIYQDRAVNPSSMFPIRSMTLRRRSDACLSGSRSYDLQSRDRRASCRHADILRARSAAATGSWFGCRSLAKLNIVSVIACSRKERHVYCQRKME